MVILQPIYILLYLLFIDEIGLLSIHILFTKQHAGKKNPYYAYTFGKYVY